MPVDPTRRKWARLRAWVREREGYHRGMMRCVKYPGTSDVRAETLRSVLLVMDMENRRESKRRRHA
jgi:hypothetical protein